jgi:rhodanese-related sulfurtransferase
MEVHALRQALAAGDSLLVLDVREHYEWAQVHLPFEGADALPVRHIPMNSVPDQLHDLPADRTIVVMCAHGNRSYGVTHWLNEQGLHASNLTGGITRWAQMGGPTERGG